VKNPHDYKEQLGKIKQLIGERGNTVVDELIERKAVTNGSIKTVLCVGV
jgi:hypothetical protein